MDKSLEIVELKLKIDKQQGIITDMTAYLKDLCLGYPNSSFLYIEAQKLITKAKSYEVKRP